MTVKKCKSNQNWNNDICRCECKNNKKYNGFKKNYIWNPATCSCENGKYVGSVTDDSLIMCDEIIEETKIVPTNFNVKTLTCKTRMSTFYLYFY